jgi:hypothetical protein
MKPRAEGREHTRRTMGVLQALRLALMQHMFLRAVSVPPFSRANDISREDVLEMVFTLRIDEALAQMRRAFPASEPHLADYTSPSRATIRTTVRWAMMRSTATSLIRSRRRRRCRCGLLRRLPICLARMGKPLIAGR